MDTRWLSVIASCSVYCSDCRTTVLSSWSSAGPCIHNELLLSFGTLSIKSVLRFVCVCVFCGRPSCDSFCFNTAPVRTGTHYPHVTWVHVMLRVQLGCERLFNIESMAQIHPSVTLLRHVISRGALVGSRASTPVTFLLSHSFREAWATCRVLLSVLSLWLFIVRKDAACS